MGRFQAIFLLRLCVTCSDDIDCGADGGVPLPLHVDILDGLEDVSKDLDVKVVGHQDKQEPVAEAEDILESVQGLAGDDGSVVGDEEHSDTRAEDGGDSEDEVDTRDDEQEEEPEPEEDVDLVIDHVDGQDAKTIKPSRKFISNLFSQFKSILLLDSSRHSKVVKSTFGHFGKDFDDWICPFFIVKEGKL